MATRLNATSTNPVWTQARAKINLAQPKTNWVDNIDGLVDKPVRFAGFSFTHKRSDAGTFFLDDLSVSESEIPAGE